jgi:hypothetical protein
MILGWQSDQAGVVDDRFVLASSFVGSMASQKSRTGVDHVVLLGQFNRVGAK